MYKQEQGNRAAARSLTALFAHFCLHHIACVKRIADIEHFSHVAFVPSTKVTGQDVHPLESMLAPKVRSPAPVQLSVNPEIASTRRSFEPGWFHVQTDIREHAADILLVDDTWVSGAREVRHGRVRVPPRTRTGGAFTTVGEDAEHERGPGAQRLNLSRCSA